MIVNAWSQAATELWGLRPDEAKGQFFLNLDIGLPVGDLREAARKALAGESPEPVELMARDRRGRPVVPLPPSPRSGGSRERSTARSSP